MVYFFFVTNFIINLRLIVRTKNSLQISLQCVELDVEISIFLSSKGGILVCLLN